MYGLASGEQVVRAIAVRREISAAINPQHPGFRGFSGFSGIDAAIAESVVWESWLCGSHRALECFYVGKTCPGRPFVSGGDAAMPAEPATATATTAVANRALIDTTAWVRGARRADSCLLFYFCNDMASWARARGLAR